MAVIKIMDEFLANKIAAGEVVERPASVIKELVENSIDAKATEIKVDLQESGTKRMQVIDNGCGMEQEDAVLAFSRHATSKLYEEEDLYRIETLGFRGEALASIASVSKITLKTSKGDIGTKVIIEGGKIVSVENADARRGTSIVVEDLFYNTPARLKHLKSLYTELASITEYFDKLALSHPDIRFVLTNNGTELLNTDGSDHLLKAIKSVFGMDITKKMREISGETDDYVVHGYMSLPEIHRSNRNGMITIVNGRVVRNVELNRVINDAYHTYKPDNRYPIVVLCITVDPSLIDVNIHPTKMDIKFSKMEDLISLIERLIKESLQHKNLIPHIEEPTEKPNVFKESILKKTCYEEVPLSFDVVEEKAPILVNDFEESSSERSFDEGSLLEREEDLESENWNPDVEEETMRMPLLYPVGQVLGTYIICQNELGMYLMDQHAAKERINYEIYKEKLGNPSEHSIPLLFPITMEFSNQDYIVLKENFSILLDMHFDIQEFGMNSILIKSHPAWLPKGYEEEAIRKIIDLVIHLEKDFTISKFNDRVAMTVSCKMSIKANESLTLEEMQVLVDDLRKCKNPFHCPHGRPTVIFYAKHDLEKLFKRSGF